MSSRSPATSGRDSTSPRKPDSAPAPVFAPSLRPWHRLFSFLRILVVIWVLLLLFLYLTTVFPHRGKTVGFELNAISTHTNAEFA
jgi:hypothetical protein